MSLIEQLAIVSAQESAEFWSLVGNVSAGAIIGVIVMLAIMRVFKFLGRFTSEQLWFIALALPIYVIGSTKPPVTPTLDFNFATDEVTVADIRFTWDVPEEGDYDGICYIQVKEDGLDWRNVGGPFQFLDGHATVTGNFVSKGMRRRFRLFIPANGRTYPVQEIL